MELPLYQIRDANERAALLCLKPVWGERKHHRDFQRLVLTYLALNGEEYSASGTPKPARRVQRLRRPATKIRKFAHWLESSKEQEMIIIPPSIRELLLSAETLPHPHGRHDARLLCQI